MLLAESQTSELNPISEIMLNLYLISPPPLISSSYSPIPLWNVVIKCLVLAPDIESSLILK